MSLVAVKKGIGEYITYNIDLTITIYSRFDD